MGNLSWHRCPEGAHKPSQPKRTGNGRFIRFCLRCRRIQRGWNAQSGRFWEWTRAFKDKPIKPAPGERRFGIWRVTVKHPRYATERFDVQAFSAADAIKACDAGRKTETMTARFLRGPKQGGHR